MNKIIVEVSIPAAGRKVEMTIPTSTQMYKVLDLMKKAISEINTGRYVPDETAVLCDKTTGNIINLNLTATELGIQNGSKLMII